ncbi:MAG: fructokinase [Lysobacterales bacterium CG17_big_fil_post_rev_8_21_14_2_50_64_11]|nr:MAG: fructokinase [Xanthomonadales bacterium CG17_big_fil_post_rev_8_21_14_2_50_64_11]PIX61425.1 MAG: fructokinase [Xanthomonadales bacterium CG_4_10_14_3_um_filter_64_11]
MTCCTLGRARTRLPCCRTIYVGCNRHEYAIVSNAPLFAAIETGGSKTVFAIGNADGELLACARCPTGDPQPTLAQALRFLRDAATRHGALHGVGIASFGPLHLHPQQPAYGHLGATPKPGWSGFDLLGSVQKQLSLPIALDTDVNAAALAEQRWGAGRDLDPLVYVTVGTGIGGGVMVHGQPLHGLLHAELGHLRPRRHPDDLHFNGICPFHGDCLEGLASGPAIIARHGASLAQLPADHPAWRIQADYLGQLCAQITLALSPQRILFGGGVMQQRALFDPIRARTQHWLGGYIGALDCAAALRDYVVPAALEPNAGILGALALAIDAAR